MKHSDFSEVDDIINFLFKIADLYNSL